MNKKAAFIFLVFTLTTFIISAQTTYLQAGHEDYHLLDRLETMSGSLSPDLFLTLKPVARKGAVNFLMEQRDSGLSLSNTDRYNIAHAISVSSEWASEEDAIDSKKPWFKTIYKKQPDFVRVNNDNFFLAASPILTGQLIQESNNDQSPLLSSTRGFEARGLIAKKIGFYTYVTENYEEPPSYVADWIERQKAVPGTDFYRTPKPGNYDYFLAKAYIDFAVIKNTINVTFGYDKHYIGDGMRTTFLSDFSAPYTFLKINTRIWKLNYQNLFMELTPQIVKATLGPDHRYPHKYAAMHHLSINVAKWLNIAVFESVIFARKDRYEFSYMVPIIFYRHVERALGSPDNVLLGLNFKALAAKHLQFYGQVYLDEFTSKEIRAGNGYWANKFAIQAGAKYFDAFTVKNLDLQGEINIVRPYTYARDSVANYTHYNQPLAHPLGAGFAEVLGQVKYQPVKNLYLSAKGMYYRQTTDTGTANFGGDIFKPYATRSEDYGVALINGVRAHCALLNVNASYELRENLFFDLGVTHRVYASMDGVFPKTETTYILGGFRLNFVKRDYDFY